MNKEEIQKKMNELNSKMQEFNSKFKDTADTVAIVGMESKDVIDKKLSEAKGDLEASKENYRLACERGKSKLASELIRAQMNFNEAQKAIKAKKDQVQKDLAEKKYELDKDKMEQAIKDNLEYADACAALAVMATEEATIAYLEAMQEQVEFEEKFGKKDK